MRKNFLSATARKRIQKMMDAVAAAPEMYNQSAYPDNGFGGQSTVCETPFCAAGFAVLANDKKLFRRLASTGQVSWRNEARTVLKLPAQVNSAYIFLTENVWPDKFRRMYEQAAYLKTPKARARRRVKAFLAYWQDILDTDGAHIRHDN